MPDEQSRLLRAILAAPDDDVPRLVYADWLRESGQNERADLIALQCAGREPETVKVLLERHASAWSAELGPGVDHVGFSRGFPRGARVQMGEADLLEVLDKAPLRSIALAAPEEGEEELLSWVEAMVDDPRLDRLQELTLQGTWGPALSALLGRPRWRNLRELAIDDGDCTPRLALLLGDPGVGLQALEGLTLFGDYRGDLGEPGLAALVSAPALQRLRSLSPLNLSLGPADARALAASRLTALQRLDLGWGSYNPNRIGPDGARALALSPAMGGLTQLVLDFNGVGDAGLAALASSPVLAQLAFLSLKGNGLGDEGLRSLAAADGLPSLVHLELTWNRDITARGLSDLVRSPRFARIEALWIRQCPQLGPEGAQAIAGSPFSVGLRDLNLLECGIGREGALALARSPYLVGLQKLQVSGNRLDEASRLALLERFGDRVDAR